MISVCIFGSQARRTADLLSDRDVLVVGNPSSARDHAVADWQARDWHVSVFDRVAFSRLANVRSLFVQHLKQEGRILRDDGSFLAAALESYLPKRDYSAERNDALRHIAALPFSSGSRWFDLCLADIIYVFFRNAAILHFASTGLYCFQYDELVARVADKFGISSEEQFALFALRDLKHAYRRRAPDCVAEPLLGLARTIIQDISSTIPNQAESSIARGDTTDEYFRLRLIELELTSRFEPSQLDVLKPEDNLFELWQQVLGAGGYPKTTRRFH
jgi:hypothetical protein